MNFIQRRLACLLTAASLALAAPLAARADGMPEDRPQHCHGPMGAPVPPFAADELGVPGDARRGGPMAGPMGPFGGAMPPFPDGLGLSEAQQDKIFAVMHGQQPLLREQEKIVRKSGEQLHSLSHSARYDEATAKRLAEAAGKAMAELELLRARGGHQVYEVLTSEQRKRADDLAKRCGGPAPRADGDAGMTAPQRP
jgi:protein CpxP